MIAVKAKGLDELKREVKAAPKLYRQAMLRAISTTRDRSKAEATRIAQTIYTAGRNKIAQAIKPGKIDRSNISFVLTATKKGLSLTDFEHTSSLQKRGKRRSNADARAGQRVRINVRVRVLKAGGLSPVLRGTFKARGRSGKQRIMQRSKSGGGFVPRTPTIALASSSVGDMFLRPAVYDRIADFGTAKMNSELLRQISVVFRG